MKNTQLAAMLAGAAAITGIATAGDKDIMSQVGAEMTDGVKITVKQKETTKVRFNGRMHFQYDALSAEDEAGDLPSTNHFYFRRLRLGAKAELANGFYGEAVYDFARNNGNGSSQGVSIDKAYIGKKFDKALSLKLGYLKVPFGFEETSSSAKIPTIERSVVARFFADDIDFSGRHSGVHASGKLGGGFKYSVAAVNAAQGEGSRLGGSAEASNDMAVFGRLQWKNDDLLIGADYGQQSNNSVVSGEDVSAWTGYVNYKVAGFNLLGEYYGADLGSQGDSKGFAVRASYKVDKWEPVVRYAKLKNDTFAIDGDELVRRGTSTNSTVSGTDNEIESIYFGVNYHYSKAVKFMAGYEIADAKNGAGTDKYDVDGVRLRLQFLW